MYWMASLGLIALGLGLIFYSEGLPLLVALGFSIIGGVVSFLLIPKLGPSFVRIGLSGRDLSKKDKPLLPESMGAVPALVYLFWIVFFHSVFYSWAC
jgi:UDP-N-acetylglucosamine--dolichyl-phosphate N-acetylglucosaminephosphotransferase